MVTGVIFWVIPVLILSLLSSLKGFENYELKKNIHSLQSSSGWYQIKFLSDVWDYGCFVGAFLRLLSTLDDFDGHLLSNWLNSILGLTTTQEASQGIT